MKRRLAVWFDLRRDQLAPEAIDQALRDGVRLSGTNLWVLFFAILVASVGLNVNATAVIIGAMLISPLMGPIIGIGYAAAVNDTSLLGRAFKNLGVFTALSLLASAAYFAASPLAEPGSELMARTAPNLWDVLIATFGGAAGMVGATRRGFNNVVPGVAIATALMPPLCTAGFGLAHGRWDMFSGATYLFTINSVFIAWATLAVARVLRLPAVSQPDEAVRRRHRVLIALGLALVGVPSVWLGARLVHEEVFASSARAVARELMADPQPSVIDHEVDARARRLVLTVIGGSEAERAVRARAEAALAQRGVGRFELRVRRIGGVPDEGELRRRIGADLTLGLAHRVVELESRLDALAATAAASAAASAPLPGAAALLAEMRALEPGLEAVSFLAGEQARGAAAEAAPALVVAVELRRPLAPAARARLEAWLAQRLGRERVQLIQIETTPRDLSRRTRG